MLLQGNVIIPCPVKSTLGRTFLNTIWKTKATTVSEYKAGSYEYRDKKDAYEQVSEYSCVRHRPIQNMAAAN